MTNSWHPGGPAHEQPPGNRASLAAAPAGPRRLRPSAIPLTPERPPLPLSTAPGAVHAALRASGMPLPAALREEAEQRFGIDLGGVHLHADNRAARASAAVGALAFTSGQSVVFGRGRYRPETAAGRELIEHELEHVAEQVAAPGGPAVLQCQADPNATQVSAEDPLPSVDTRAGELVEQIVINLDDGRVAFFTAQGPPIRGTVDTDLAPGAYAVQVDTHPRGGLQRGAAIQWKFDPGQVRAGLRFDLTLDGALPETLAYAGKVPVIVTHGFTPDGEHSLAEIQRQVVELIDGLDYHGAIELLASLSDVDLADLASALQEQGAAMVLLTHFAEGVKGQMFGTEGVLRALEAVERSAKDLYVDAFDSFVVDKSSFSRNPEREAQGKWNIKLVFSYNGPPARALAIFADDIASDEAVPKAKPHYGPGDLLYPDRLTAGSVPRIWNARKQAIDDIERGNLTFVQTAYQGAQLVIDLTLMGQGLLTSTIPAASTGMSAAAGGLRRPITEAFEAQPGRWVDDFEGGANMSEAAAAYQARVCNAAKGKGYYVKGVQFDGYEGGKLLDAKYYPEGSGMARSLERDNYFVGNKLADQARRQLTAAAGTKVEWRVASEGAANKIRQLFSVNGIPIDVVFVP